MADVGLPLLATLLGLLIAVVLVRSQLRHDVKLRQAERREAVVWRFADECIDLANNLMDRRHPLEYWLQERWPDWGRLHFAAKQVEWHLGEGPAFEEIVEGATDLTHAWGACRERLEQLSASGTVIDQKAHMEAVWRVTQGLAVHILVAGRKLLSYDGTKPLSTFKPWPAEHVPDEPSKRDLWRRKHADHYERVAKREMARRSS